MTTTLATKEAATALGISASTMRNWSDHYADYLSESGRAGHQPERRFTEHDITVLTYIKQLRTEGMQAGQIRQRLSETRFSDVEVLQQQTPTIDYNPLQTTTDPQQEPTAALMVIDAMRADIEALKQTAASNQRLVRDGVLMFMLGGVTVLLFVLIIIVVADLWAK